VALKTHLTAAGMEREMARKEQERAARAEQLRAATAPRAERLSGEFVTVKGGCFQMGDLFGDGAAKEK